MLAEIYKLTKRRSAQPGAPWAINRRRTFWTEHSKNSKKLPLERVIYGLGIRMVGDADGAVSGGSIFGSMEEFEKASVEELQAVN